MKLMTGWAVSAALVLAATTANAQLRAPSAVRDSAVIAVSDFEGPYTDAPPPAPVPAPRYGYEPSYGPPLLPPTEVYAVLRENGFLPLGIPHQRGLVYVIAVTEAAGDHGRLVIDARDGRIIRFIRAYGMGGPFEGDLSDSYGAAEPVVPLATHIRSSVPRPPLPIPHVASRTVPTPKPSPLAARPAPTPAPAQQAAAAPPAAPSAAPSVVEAKPAAPAILPTQPMPAVQGLE